MSSLRPLRILALCGSLCHVTSGTGAGVSLREVVLAAMKEAGLKKQQLAVRLAEQTGKSLDTTRRYVNRWTSEKVARRRLSLFWAEALAEALGKPAEAFLAPRAPAGDGDGSEVEDLRASHQELEATVAKLARTVESLRRRIVALERRLPGEDRGTAAGAQKR